MESFQKYLHEWAEWDGQVVDHLQTRCCLFSISGRECGWSFDYNTYKKYLVIDQQDLDLQRRWAAAHKVHKQRVADFRAYELKMNRKES
jgi:hypothetical protein